MRFTIYRIHVGVCLLISFAFLAFQTGFAQPQQKPGFKFAQVTDTHVGGSTGVEDLIRTVEDLNRQDEIDFVIFSGDITEFGSDEELNKAKSILDNLQKPWYVIPGNHDTNWSESGGNSFLKVFGNETFAFGHKGYFFIGTNSGPNMRMSPGQIPRENLVRMDSILQNEVEGRTPIIYVNHYPQDSSLNNWFDAVDRLKRFNVQMALCGHGHQNRPFDFDGIPGVMVRSNLRAKDTVGAYHIISLVDGKAEFFMRYPGVKTVDTPWHIVEIRDRQLHLTMDRYRRPDYSVNQKYSDQINVAWEFQDDSDLGAGFSSDGKLLFTANTAGQVYALNLKDGSKVWTFQTEGKVYSTPEVWKNHLLVGGSDHKIYCLDARTGILKWSYEAEKAVLGSPLIEKGVAFIGASDGRFRAFDLRSGRLLWDFEGVKGHVSAKPLLYQGKLYFGSWGNDFYALDPKTGTKIWEWSNGSRSRMLSPAACYPVGSNGRVFIVAPDRYMTALDAQTGEVIWRANDEKKSGARVRESMGLSEDRRLVYAKTMDGNLLGFSTRQDTMEIAWRSALQLPYELAPTAILANNGIVFVPSHSGLLSAIDARSGAVLWQYRISNAMINPMLTIKNNSIVASTMDGKIVKINF